MIVDKYGRVAGSIDLATLAQMYAQTDDDDLKAHYRQVAAENGSELGEATDVPAVEAEPGDERTDSEREADANAELGRLQIAAEAAGVKADKRWGVDRLREEIAKARKE